MEIIRTITKQQCVVCENKAILISGTEDKRWLCDKCWAVDHCRECDDLFVENDDQTRKSSGRCWQCACNDHISDIDWGAL